MAIFTSLSRLEIINKYSIHRTSSPLDQCLQPGIKGQLKWFNNFSFNPNVTQNRASKWSKYLKGFTNGEPLNCLSKQRPFERLKSLLWPSVILYIGGRSMIRCWWAAFESDLCGIEPRKQNRLTFRQPAVNTATVDPLLSLTARAPNYWLPMCKKLKYWNTLATPQKRCCMTRRDCATETMIFSWPECDTCDFFSRATIGRIVCQTKWHKTPIHLPIPKLVQTNSDLW